MESVAYDKTSGKRNVVFLVLSILLYKMNDAIVTGLRWHSSLAARLVQSGQTSF